VNSSSPSRIALGVYFVTAACVLGIVGGLAWFLSYKTRSAPLNQARIEERIKNLRDINAAASDALNNYGWQDQSKNLIRLPVADAMDLIVREWKNPAVGRSNLLTRLDKANPPPPPPAPPKPTVFE
jgi:hypothetical protein